MIGKVAGRVCVWEEVGAGCYFCFLEVSVDDIHGGLFSAEVNWEGEDKRSQKIGEGRVEGYV